MRCVIIWKACYMADVAQLVRALDCGSGGRGFESHHSPQALIYGVVCAKIANMGQ